jgi:1,4-dihydroxy-2-naphthoate octaprenyltransferase
LLLAPIFLWGWLLAGGRVDARLGFAFVVFHVFLYGGITAYNSAYDRDEGPVGGLERPPPVSPMLLPFAVSVKLAGWALAWLLNPPFALLYGVIALLSVGYSHPRIRFKAYPPAALATVAIGQGILPFLAAWAAVRGELWSGLALLPLLGALAASGIVLGFYPLTQLFQIDEDRARGDRTVAVAWGPGNAFRLSLACFALGGGALCVVIGSRWAWTEALVVGLGHVGLLASVAHWQRAFQPGQVLGNFRRVMRLNAAGALGFGGYLLAKLVVSV